MSDDKKNKKYPDNPEHMKPGMPEDPANINPEELASFPKEKKEDDADLDEMRDPHLNSVKKDGVRSGRNITRTGPNPDKDGYM